MSELADDAHTEAIMYFKSNKNPRERGALALTDEGKIEVRPSEDFLDELARIEDEVVTKSRFVASRVGGGIIVFGLLIAAAGWLVGRIGGKLRIRVTTPQDVDKVTMFADVTGGFHLTLPGKYGQVIQLNWGQGEINPREAGEFLKAARKYRQKPEDNPVFR